MRTRLLLVLLVVPVALAARWYGPAEPRGPRFEPRPDALEYAASAQSIAQSGRMYLQVGPHRVRPRYPPGWPLLLAGAIRLGVPAEHLWKVTGLFGAALAALLALLAAEATRRLVPHPPGPPLPSALTSSRERGEEEPTQRFLADRSPLPEVGSADGRGAGGEGSGPSPASSWPWWPLVAGLFAGWTWGLAPVGLLMGQTLLSDEPAACVSIAGLVLAGLGLLRTGDARAALALTAAGGLAFGLAATMRTVSGALMAPPLAVFFLAALRRQGLRSVLKHAAAFILGAAVFPAITCQVLVRSGLPAWEWSGYRFWVPRRFGRGGDAFSLRYAFEPYSPFRIGPGRKPLPHLEVAARVLLGIPGLRIYHYAGLLWPALGWLAAIPLWRSARRRGGAPAELAPWIAAALLLWTLAHIALFSTYFYPAGRFYVGPQALSLLLLATACGLGLSRPDRRMKLAAGLTAAVVLGMTLYAFADVRDDRLPPLKRTEWNVAGKLARWRELSAERRSWRTMPFDPVHAQALGLLPPEVADSIGDSAGSWGKLPATRQVQRLRAIGLVKPDEIAKPKPGAGRRMKPRRNDDDGND